MAEDLGLCTASKHHKLKILMYFSAMRAYRDALVKRGFEVFYHAIGENDFLAPFEQKLKLVITKEQITEVNYFEIEDHFFADQLDQILSKTSST